MPKLNQDRRLWAENYNRINKGWWWKKYIKSYRECKLLEQKWRKQIKEEMKN